MISDIKIIFLGTPEFSAIILEKMIKANYIPISVITALDKPVGRKQILTSSATKVIAVKYNIPVLQSENIKNLKLKIKNLQPEIVVLAAYGQIIPKEILEIPKYGCLNLHPSLLPKYRGASPIQTAILNNDKEVGTTIMLMDEKLDHGPIVVQQRLEILNSNIEIRDKFKIQMNKITTPELTNLLAEIGAELLIKIIPKWVKGEVKAQPQGHAKATYTKIIKKEDGWINWQKSAEETERMIRAYHSWPSAYTYYKFETPAYAKAPVCAGRSADGRNSKSKKNSNVQNQKMLKILKASVLKTENKKKPGTVSTSTPKKELTVACGKNALILEEVQLEGKKIMTAKEFLNGYPEIINSVLI